ncbi:MAG: DUF2155 domain-containing protein [Paracoccaceae bacterium]
MLNKTLAFALLGVIAVQLASAQSLLDEIQPEISIETLAESEYSLPVAYNEIEFQPPMSDEAQIVLLRGLDRINGTTQDISVMVGDTVTYEQLEVTLLVCRYPKGDINNDAFAQMIIRDVREETPRFIGWMFASSPVLSALDHPRYDVWVLSCQSL